MRLAATFLQVDWKDNVLKGVVCVDAAKEFWEERGARVSVTL